MLNRKVKRALRRINLLQLHANKASGMKAGTATKEMLGRCP